MCWTSTLALTLWFGRSYGATVALLSDRVAVVLGGSRGIGRPTVEVLAGDGATVVFTGRKDGPGETLLEEVRGEGGDAHFAPIDLTSQAEVERLLQETAQRFGRLDICVSSGAPRIPLPKPFDQTDAKAALELFLSRFTPRLWTVFAAGRIMAEHGYGKIVLMTTDAGRLPTRSESIVGTAGAAVIFMTRAFARELAPRGVRVNAVSTTITRDTPSFDAFRAAEQPTGHTEVIHQAFAAAEKRAAFGLNSALDVATLIRFLCGPESDQISGATVSINGGLSFPAY